MCEFKLVFLLGMEECLCPNLPVNESCYKIYVPSFLFFPFFFFFFFCEVCSVMELVQWLVCKKFIPPSLHVIRIVQPQLYEALKLLRVAAHSNAHRL